MDYPAFFRERLFSNQEALVNCVKNGTGIASGFATSEPLTFYRALWDHIRENDLHDINIRQALFMAPHQVCVGDALSAKGFFKDWENAFARFPVLGPGITRLNTATKKMDGLKKLLAHYDELIERRVTFTSAFIGPATNIAIPDNFMTRALFSSYAGRNTSRMGITDMHSIHFPDAVNSMGYDADGKAKMDLYVMVMTPPDQSGEMSHGPANGANAEALSMILQKRDVNLILYLNPGYPFTRGYGPAPNTAHVDDFKGLAEAGRLFVVEDRAEIPSLPAGAFDNPAREELAIAENLVNHVEMNKRFTYGRALQVGIGSTGVQAIRLLKDSGWRGRSYTEMLEPFMMALFEAGKIKGSHFIEDNGTRVMLDGRLVCTFTLCEKGSGFYEKLDRNEAAVIGAASRVVIAEGFHGGMGINNILAVDFHGHVNAGGRDKNHYSGIGGSAKIMRGLSKGGVGYLCLKSTHRTPEGKLRSSIFPFMPRGTPISLVGPDIMGGRDNARFFLVTEHGVARVSGMPQSEFVRAIISVAHPRFRDWLAREAWKEFRIKV